MAPSVDGAIHFRSSAHVPIPMPAFMKRIAAARPWRAGTVALGVLVSVAAARGNDRPTPTEIPVSCPAGAWGPALQLGSGGSHSANAIMRSPSLAVVDGQAFVAGMNLPFVVEPVPSGSFTAYSLSTGSIDRPPGRFRFRYPRLYAAPDDDELLAVWGETSPADSNGGLQANIEQIWTSAFRGGQWSQPQLLATAPWFFWNVAEASTAWTDTARTLHILIPRVPDEENEGTLELRYRHGMWSAAMVHVGVNAGYAAVAPVSDGAVLAIATGGVRSLATSRIFITRTRDRGASWAPPWLLAAADSGPASGITALSVDAKTVHVLWGESVTSGITPDVIRHFVSNDLGRTFTRLEDLRPPRGFDAIRAVADRCGVLHLVYEHRFVDSSGAFRVHLDYVAWRGTWSPPQHLSPEQDGFSANLAYDSTGNILRLVWLSRPAGSPLRSAVSTFLSELHAPG